MPLSRVIQITASALANNIVAGNTSFAGLGGHSTNSLELNARTRVFNTLTWRNLYVRVVTNATTAASTVISRRNGANGNQSVTVGSGATGEFEDTVNTDSLTDGNQANYQFVAGTGGNVSWSVFSSILEQTTTMTSVVRGEGPEFLERGTTNYSVVAGNTDTSTTESERQYTIRTAGTSSRLQFRLSLNATANGGTVTFRLNGAAGNQSVSFAGGATGDFEDSVNTDTLAAGDEIDYELDINGGGMPDNVNFTHVQTRLEVSESEGNSYLAIAGGTFLQPDGNIRFVTSSGDIDDTPTESRTQTKVRGITGGVLNAINFFVRVFANSLDGNMVYRHRINAGDGNLIVTVGSGATGAFEDQTNTDTLIDDDEINYEHDGTGSTVGVIEHSVIAIQLQVVSDNIHSKFLRTTMYSALGARSERRLVPGIVTEPFRSFYLPTPGPAAAPTININTIFMSTTMYSTYDRAFRRLLPGIVTEPFRSFRLPLIGQVPPTININTIFMGTTMYSTYARGVRRLLPGAAETFPKSFFTKGPPPAISVFILFPRMPMIPEIISERNRTFFIIIPGGAVVRVRYLGDGIAITF